MIRYISTTTTCFYNTHTLSSRFTGRCFDDVIDDVIVDDILLKFMEFEGVNSPLLFIEGACELEGDISCSFTPRGWKN